MKDVVDDRLTLPDWVVALTETVPFGVVAVIGRVVTALPLASVTPVVVNFLPLA